MGIVGLIQIVKIDPKYTLEKPLLSPPRKPLSMEMEARFEELTLAYLSPEARASVSSAGLRSARSSRLSCGSTASAASSATLADSTGLLRFVQR